MPTPQRHLASALIGVSCSVLLVVGTVGLLGSADAATPAEGTLSPTAATLTWTGAPLAPSNPTSVFLGTAVCAPETCDDFALSVSVPADYDATHEVALTLSGDGGGDYDLQVLNSDGDVIASGENAGDEALSIPAVAGSYTVRVLAFEQVADSYSASATLVGAAGGPTETATPDPTPTPVPAGAPTFTTYAAPASFTDVHNAGEPSIGTSFVTGATMYQSSLSTYRATFDDASPAQVTWTDVSADASTGCPQGSTTSLDPILYTDHESGRTLESQLTGVDSFTCYTDDDGATWNPSMGGGIPSGVDHQTLGGGPYSANGVGALPTSSYPNAVYYCSQDIATAFCAASRDGGATFGAGVPTYDLSQCVGLHGHVKVAPDGTAYLPNKGCNGEQAVVVSDDNGTSWTVRPVPGSTEGDSDPSVGTARNGTVYFGYVGADGRPAVAVSRDRGQTWTDRQTVGTAYGISNAVFPTVVAGDDDRAAFAYLGTPTGGDYQDSANFTGVWHLYVDTTYDGGKTWVTTDATPTDPVQRGSICTGGTTCGSDRNLLDFIDVTLDDHGRVLVGFADGCTAACVSDPAVNTFDAYATIARQSTGKTLYAKYDPVAARVDLTETATPTETATTNLRVRLLSVRNHRGRLVARLRLVNSGNQLLRGVEAVVRDNGKAVGRVPAFRLQPGSTAVRTVRWRHARPVTTHRVVAVGDPQDLIAETDETDNRAQREVRLR